MQFPHTLPSLPDRDLWVFGYGSLLWRPGFDFVESHQAKLYGYHRALCVWSWVHRGTPEAPGLVLGLEMGGCCVGRAFRIHNDDKHRAVRYLYERELVTPVYLPRFRGVHLSARRVNALLFTVDRRHPQYAGKLDLDTAARIVRSAQGQSGPNAEYVRNTAQHLSDMGIADQLLSQLEAMLAGEQPVNEKA